MHRITAAALTTSLLLAACSGQTDPTAAAASDLADTLPDGWSTTVIDDAQVGTFVVAEPAGATRWLIGEPTDDLAEATADTAWASFWLPALQASSDRSNLRALIVDTDSLPDTVISWQINVNTVDVGLELDGPEELAADLRSRFESQGLEVVESGTVAWHDDTIAAVAFRVPSETFGDEARYVRQWFIAERDPDTMWSFSCDAPDDPDATAELCRTGLDGFLTDPDGPDASNDA